MNEWQDRLDGVQRWFYGGEPGMDDLPRDDEAAPALPAEETQAHPCLCHACARAPQR